MIMRLLRKIVISILGLSFLLNACQANPSVEEIQTESTETPNIISTTAPKFTKTPVSIISTTDMVESDYSLCGEGDLVEVPYFFKDQNGVVSPTQLVRFLSTSDNVRRYVSVITCLKYDEGWTSNSDEVENGYENVIIFFDKYGKAHPYRIIIGGHYIAPYDPSHKDITGSLNGIDVQYYDLMDWKDVTKKSFQNNQSRQIGVNIYLEDNQGDLSNVLRQVYAFKDTNLQIEEALRTGEGYPEELPEGFFLFATESWLITAE
jgi:hypothetical protein